MQLETIAWSLPHKMGQLFAENFEPPSKYINIYTYRLKPFKKKI